MKSYEIILSNEKIYKTKRKFANKDEAHDWAEEQGGSVDLYDHPDWSFYDGTFEVIEITEEYV